MTYKTICICGAGTMGSGIAQLSAQKGFNTILYELNPDVLRKSKENISKNLQSLAEKGKIDQGEKEPILQRITFTGEISACIADFFIEAILEKPEPKISLLNQLAEINKAETIFATNTSSLSVTAIAEATKIPDRIVGMHFFNPATIMKLVEIVRTPFTSDELIKKVGSLAAKLGKTSVLCSDSPGFIVNHVARPYYIESLRLIEEGLTDFSQIDRLLEATGFKMGPFKLMDLIGNDINYAVSCSVYDQLKKPERLKPSYIQQQKVEANELGKKTGKGYYSY